MHLFVTGTDTEIGKTYFSAWLVRQWRQRGLHAAGIKPISCGGMEDAEALRAAADDELTLAEVNAIRFPSPVAPHVATLVDRMPFDWDAMNASLAAARARFTHLAIEGVGGWLVPLDGKKLVRDWAVEMQLPTLIVARAGLGTINHTLLTVESIERSGVPIAGIVLNAGLADSSAANYPQAFATNAETIASLVPYPIFVFNRVSEAKGVLPEWLVKAAC